MTLQELTIGRNPLRLTRVTSSTSAAMLEFDHQLVFFDNATMTEIKRVDLVCRRPYDLAIR